ncbi:holo-ACP synthase [Marinicrinis sediminis]|uniref:Holo-[acyl-carrier-protein] synthase n=1 Tax=Marinicrinis sediminis TaxID=1652465 RepID=A0ABW5REV3_9BACL
MGIGVEVHEAAQRHHTIIGIGCDIQQISSLKQTMDRQSRFVPSLFTAAEISYCESRGRPEQHFAARWAAKEAFYKAVSRLLEGPIPFRQVEICHANGGQPCLNLYGELKQQCEARGLAFYLSLSHSADMAMAYIVAVTHNETGASP